MSGHSKWSTIKRKKGTADAKRSKIFTKLIKEITVAARIGGGDPGGNPRLRLAIDKARAQSLPRDTMERAIKKGTGELVGHHYEEVTYEGYGAAGVAVMVDCLTDNKIRTIADIRHIFTKNHGHTGESGSVSWGFERKGTIIVDAKTISEEALFEKAIEAGAEDLKRDGDELAVHDFTILTAYEDFLHVKDGLEKAGVAIKESTIARVPKTTVKIDDSHAARQILDLMETLEDHDDVQSVWANFDIDEKILAELA